MKETPPGDNRRGAGKSKSSKHLYSTPARSHKVATAAIASLAGLERLRYSFDVWKVLGCHGDMPQPVAFGLRLPDLDPAKVLWGAS